MVALGTVRMSHPCCFGKRGMKSDACHEERLRWGCLACSQPALSLTQTWPVAMGVGGLMADSPLLPKGGQNPCLELTCFWTVVASFKFDAGRTNSKYLLLGHQGLRAPIFSLPSLGKPHPISCTL